MDVSFLFRSTAPDLPQEGDHSSLPPGKISSEQLA